MGAPSSQPSHLVSRNSPKLCELSVKKWPGDHKQVSTNIQNSLEQSNSSQHKLTALYARIYNLAV